MFLTPDELVELTGKKRRNAQERALRGLGIEYKVRPSGGIIVLRSYVEKVLDGSYSKCYTIRDDNLEPDWGTIK